MNIITVIPLTRSKMVSELSYFTASDVPKGAVVSVPLRSKNVNAIVVAVRPVSDMKSDIKDATYALKKLGNVKATAFFPTVFIETVQSLAQYYATTLGSIIESTTVKAIIEHSDTIQPPLTPLSPTGRNEKIAVQGDDVDRISSWRSLIRQEFARKKSVVCYVPTIEDAKNMFTHLEKGIEGYIFALHSGLSEKQVLATWNSIATTNHSILIIATGSFSLLPRSDIETVIIERENGRGWISQRQPYLDLRHTLEILAVKNKQTLYLADSLLRTETLSRIDHHELIEGTPFKWRSVGTAEEVLVDMRKVPEQRQITQTDSEQESESKKEDTKPTFKVLSPELKALIAQNREDNSHLFIYTVRRGMSPTTVCADCETIVSCKNCSAPVVLHTSKESGKNFFMCHKCGERRSAIETCSQCGSWRLTPLGIGIDRVAEEIAQIFPLTDIFKIDADSTTTEKQISTVLEKFRAKPGSILLGTDMALLHMSEHVEHVAVASIDSLFALPDFRIQEKIMYTLIRLRSIANRTFLVQTRKPKEKVFEYGIKGNLSDFYRMTLEERKQFLYPPYSLLIKLTIEGKKDVIANDMSAYVKLLEPHEVSIFPAFTSTVRGNSVIHGLITLKPKQWPDAELVAKLRSLPPHVSVKIAPESLL